jgi:hypothetical protein
VNAGINTPAFIYVPVNGDVVQCMLTSSDTICTTNNPATSNAITMVVDPLQPVSLSISSSVNPFCPGSAVTFTASPINGGSTPVYQWKVNGINAGTNASTFTYNPQNNDSVCCILTSNLNCATGNPVSSAKIIMSGTLAPVVTFTSCFDTITTIGAKPFRLKGGIPLGGSYSGPGVNSVSGTFHPAAAGTGVHQIGYSYTNAHGCVSGAIRNVQCVNSGTFTCGGTLTDIRDGKTSPTVLIGSHCWMAASLEYGVTIDELTPQTDNCIAEYYTIPGDSPSSHFTFHSYRFAFFNSNLKSEKSNVKRKM